jgi:hypothetical protein
MALLTAEEYLSFIGSTSTPTVQIQMLCDAMSDSVERYIGRPIEKAQRTEYYSSNGKKSIPLRVRPVWSVDEVRWDALAYYENRPDSFDSTTVQVEGVDWALHTIETPTNDRNSTGLLVRIPGDWIERPRWRDRHKLYMDDQLQWGDIKVTYTAGYDPIPASIKLAVSLLVKRVQVTLQKGGNLAMEKLGDHLYKLRDTDFKHPELSEVRSILSKFKDVPW